VLVLYSDERLLPANIILDQAIRAAFAVGTNNRVEFYSEFLDVARFPGEEQQQRDFFRDKYLERPPDLVIAVSGGALVFLADTGLNCSPEYRLFIVPSLVIRIRLTFQTPGSRKSKCPIALLPQWR
jgi:hypothetical protein